MTIQTPADLVHYIRQPTKSVSQDVKAVENFVEKRIKEHENKRLEELTLLINKLKQHYPSIKTLRLWKG